MWCCCCKSKPQADPELPAVPEEEVYDKNTKEYWAAEMDRAHEKLELQKDIAEFQRDYWNPDVGSSSATPNGVGFATLPPSYGKLESNPALRRYNEVRDKWLSFPPIDST